jgi:hypothetical protein
VLKEVIVLTVTFGDVNIVFGYGFCIRICNDRVLFLVVLGIKNTVGRLCPKV